MKRILLAVLLLCSTAFASKSVDDKYSRSTYATVNETAVSMFGRPCKNLNSTKFATLKEATKEIEGVYKLTPGFSTELMPNGMVYLTPPSGKGVTLGKFMFTYLFTDKVNGGFYATHCS